MCLGLIGFGALHTTKAKHNCANPELPENRNVIINRTFSITFSVPLVPQALLRIGVRFELRPQQGVGWLHAPPAPPVRRLIAHAHAHAHATSSSSTTTVPDPDQTASAAARLRQLSQRPSRVFREISAPRGRIPTLQPRTRKTPTQKACLQHFLIIN